MKQAFVYTYILYTRIFAYTFTTIKSEVFPFMISYRKTSTQLI